MKMETFCVNLWMTLSRVIGTEEQILIRRRVHELITNYINSKGSTFLRTIRSGSRAEGLDLEGSDYDFMYVYDGVSVAMPDTLLEHNSDVVIETHCIKPGFVRLRCKPNISNHGILLSSLVQANKGLFLSSLFFRDTVVDIVKGKYPETFAHGPCASNVETGIDRRLEYDNMMCLACNTWPSMEWRYRSKHHNWPSFALVEEIIGEGCLLVPIGNPNSQHNFLEWRISFSLAEKKLVHSFNHTQFMCYGLLKLFLKHVINSNSEAKDLLCSYFLKTSLFYCIEEESISWCKENLFDCFWTCFRRLLKWVQQGYCPNYFIKDNNMFESKICGPRQGILLRFLSELDAEGVYCIQKIPCLSELFIPEFQRVISSYIGRQEKELLCDKELKSKSRCVSIKFASQDEQRKVLSMLGNMMQEAISNADKSILKIDYIISLSILEQFLYKDTLRSMPNKSRYKAIKFLKRHMIKNKMNGDRCTRMLQLAIVCYLNGEYQDVVSIAEGALAVHGRFLTMAHNDQIYMDEICGKGYTLQQKLELGLFSDMYWCVLDCGLYPQEIRTELFQFAIKDSTLIPTLVYFYVLLVLSYYHLKLKQKMICALNEFYLAVQDVSCNILSGLIATSLLNKCLEVAEQDLHVFHGND